MNLEIENSNLDFDESIAQVQVKELVFFRIF